MASLADDLNAAQALGRLFTLIPQAESALVSDPSGRESVLAGFDRVMYAFGFRLEANTAPEGQLEIPADIHALAEARWQAKQSRDWAKADALRGDLSSRGWVVKDTKDGYSLSPVAG